jgi:hypothetical protein
MRGGRLCSRIARALRPGRRRYIEDLCQHAPFAKDDLRDLREVVFGITVTSIEDYVEDLLPPASQMSRQPT